MSRRLEDELPASVYFSIISCSKNGERLEEEEEEECMLATLCWKKPKDFSMG